MGSLSGSFPFTQKKRHPEYCDDGHLDGRNEDSDVMCEEDAEKVLGSKSNLHMGNI